MVTEKKENYNRILNACFLCGEPAGNIIEREDGAEVYICDHCNALAHRHEIKMEVKAVMNKAREIAAECQVSVITAMCALMEGELA